VQTDAANARVRASTSGNTQDFVSDEITYGLSVGVDPQAVLQQPAQQPSQSSYGGGGNSQSTQDYGSYTNEASSKRRP